MKLMISLLLALCAGYLGGCLALRQSCTKEKEELRQVVDELLSELQFTAEESCRRLLEEQKRLRGLSKKNSGFTPSANSNNIESVDPILGIVTHGELADLSLYESKISNGGLVQTARDLGLGTGEVELMVKLNRSGQDHEKA